MENNNTQPNQSETANTNQPIADITPIVTDSVKPIPEQETSAKQTNEPTQVIPKPIKVIIDGDNRKSTAPRIANIIAGVSVIISAVMFYYTFRLFNETRRANNIADSNYHLAKAAFESSNKSGKESYELAKQSLDAQIKSIEENNNRFAIDNEPFLEANSPIVTQFKTGEPVTIFYTIVNLGSKPVQEYSGRTFLESIPKKDYNDFIKNPFGVKYKDKMSSKLEISKRYLINQNRTFIPLSSPILPKSIFDAIAKKEEVLFIYGESRYINMVNKKKRVYKFIIELVPNGSEISPFSEKPNYGYIYNKNEDIK